MWNLFEQPWTLVGISVLVLFGVLTFRSVWPEKRKFWQLLVPLAVAGSGFALDGLVVTDLESIQKTMKALLVAVTNEDCDAVAKWIAPDYSDIRHASKAALLKQCKEQLNGQTIAKIDTIGKEIDRTENQAKVTLVLSVKFDEQSAIAKQHGVTGCMPKVEMTLTKQPDRHWLVKRIEILEVDRVPVTWKDV